MRLPVTVTVDGDTIRLDLAGAPPQVAQGGINCTLGYTCAHATYPLKCMLTPQVRGNADCYRPFTVDVPDRVDLCRALPRVGQFAHPDGVVHCADRLFGRT